MNGNNFYERLRTAIDKDKFFTPHEKLAFNALLIEQLSEQLTEDVDKYCSEQRAFADKLMLMKNTLQNGN